MLSATDRPRQHCRAVDQYLLKQQVYSLETS
jgi:hypothetical protein